MLVAEMIAASVRLVTVYSRMGTASLGYVLPDGVIYQANGTYAVPASQMPLKMHRFEEDAGAFALSVQETY